MARPKKKTIDTLVEDIEAVLGNQSIYDLSEELASKFGERMKSLVETRLKNEKAEENYSPSLRISNIGKPCERQTWLAIKYPHLAEPLPPSARLKFLYGDVTEELLLFLAELAGHKVEGCQDEIMVEGVKGHRDAVIDGVLIDVKSASTYGFQKFKEHRIPEDDPFGYFGQIQTYLEGCQEDPLVTDKKRCGFLVMDKTLGHIVLDLYDRIDFDIKALTRKKKEIMEGDVKPQRRFEPQPDGAKGNMKLGMECSYCNMKVACHPQLKMYLYSNGPRYLTSVVNEPKVDEHEPEWMADIRAMALTEVEPD